MQLSFRKYIFKPWNCNISEITCKKIPLKKFIKLDMALM